jgi:pimeloyl-ACP methyl ester carboxylesterase
VNGIRIYYEIYGVGPPLLLIHGNTGSIIRMSCQINAFSPSRMVIAVDTRGRGKSGDGVARFTFEQQADDLAVLLARERVTPTDVLGQSDGGIVALLLGIRHPAAVRRIVASAPNLRPDDTALVPDSIARLKANIAAAERQIAAGDRTQDWERRRRQLQQDLEEPHLTRDQLRQIDAPVLLVGADEDVIRPEHYLEMYRSLPHGQLFIVPGTIHGQLLQSPLFGAAAQRFFDEPFARPVAFPQASQP